MSRVFENIAQWLQQHSLTCPVKHYLRVDCPGCGMQRSLVALLRGNLRESLLFHPVTIPLLLFFLLAALHLKFRFKQGNRLIVWSYIAVTGLLTLNYLYRIFNHTITT